MQKKNGFIAYRPMKPFEQINKSGAIRAVYEPFPAGIIPGSYHVKGNGIVALGVIVNDFDFIVKHKNGVHKSLDQPFLAFRIIYICISETVKEEKNVILR